MTASAKRLRKRHNLPICPNSDLGPRHQHVIGRLVVTQAADPDAPNRTIKRAQARCHYDALHSRGGLTDPEREAADRYAVLCEMEAGARDRPTIPSGRVPGWMQGHPAQTQIQAVAGLRAVHEAVGREGTILLRLYVRDNQAAEVIATNRDEDRKVTTGRIKATLARAAEHWKMLD